MGSGATTKFNYFRKDVERASISVSSADSICYGVGTVAQRFYYAYMIIVRLLAMTI